MRADVADELAVIRAWRDVQAPGDTRDAMVAGFLWALALVADQDVVELRARLDAPRRPEDAFRPAAPVTASGPAGVTAAELERIAGGPLVPGSSWAEPRPDPESAPPWPGLGIDRIPRTREAGDQPVGQARAYTAGPDGRPVALEASYAEMAADSDRDDEPPEP